MSKETKTKNIYQKLLSIQQHIIGLGKDKAAYGYKYVTGDKVMEHIKPLMNDLGLLLKQEVISIENTRQDYQTKGGSTSEINSKVMMRFTWVDVETGEKDENLFGANGQNAWDKGVGSALTYGERYFLLKYFHIATDEDDIDNPESKKPTIVPDSKPKEALSAPKEEAAKPDQINLINALLKSELVSDDMRKRVTAKINDFSMDAAAKTIVILKGIVEAPKMHVEPENEPEIKALSDEPITQKMKDELILLMNKCKYQPKIMIEQTKKINALKNMEEAELLKSFYTQSAAA